MYCKVYGSRIQDSSATNKPVLAGGRAQSSYQSILQYISNNNCTSKKGSADNLIQKSNHRFHAIDKLNVLKLNT